jgi:c-di-GMP-binding flagellar brake protein YcgR
MNISDITSLGDKIDIQLVQQLERAEQGETTEPIRTYKSSLFDYRKDKEIEIAMPTENGRMVLFQVGLRVRMLFYTKKGLYICYGSVQRRYKKDNLFMMAMLVTSEPKKYQRREFFRIENSLEIRYVVIPEELAFVDSTESLYAQLQLQDLLKQTKTAITLDISGGGIRFSADEQLENNCYAVVIVRLTNDKLDHTFYLVTEVVEAIRAENNPEKFIHRGKFMFKDLKDRETIVRYVFEEERRIRRKEMT